MKSKLIILTSLVISLSCENQSENIQKAAIKNGSEIMLTNEQIRSSGIITKNIKSMIITESVNTNGYLEVPPNQISTISPVIGGHIKKLNILVGDKVKKGQMLATLSSPEFIELQSQYLEIKNSLKFLEDNYKRNKLLAEDKINARKELVRSESEYREALTKSGSIEQTLRLLGVNLKRLNNGDISEWMYLRAPITGEVSKVSGAPGDYKGPADPILTVVDRHHLHAELKVYESDMHKISVGQNIRFTVPLIGKRVFRGKTYLVSNVIDQKDRSVRVHAHFEDSLNILRIGSYVNGVVIIGEKEVLAVEEKAIISDNGNPYIFIAKGGNEDTFEKIRVETGRVSDGWVEIKNLKSGTKYVSEGAYHLSGID